MHGQKSKCGISSTNLIKNLMSKKSCETIILSQRTTPKRAFRSALDFQSGTMSRLSRANISVFDISPF